MALYRYQALGDGGVKVNGVIDADSYDVAKERLRKQRLMVTALTALKQNRSEISLDASLLLTFTREFGQLLKAGLPVYESLLTIEEKYRRHKSHPLFLDLCDRIKNGSSLSAALKNYPKTFDPIYLSMVQAAEQTSSLPSIFLQLSALIAKQQRLKKQLISSLTYPAFLGGFCLLVLLSLLLFVIPSIEELFEGRALHPLTATVLVLSRFVRESGLYLLCGVLAAGTFLYLYMRKEAGRLLVQTWLLRLPFFKTLAIQSALIRFCRAFSILLTGGVPLIEALALSRKVLKQLSLEKIMEDAEKKIVEGQKLSERLRASPLIPNLVVRMLSIAEETGKMAPMLLNIAEIYDEELEKNLAQLTSFLQPLLLMVLGGIVGLVLLSVLLPLTDVSSFVS